MELLAVLNISLIEHGTTVLHPLSFGQAQGQKLAIAGESGAGKSTLLQLIAGLVQPSTGEIRIEGSRVRGPAVALVPGHPGVAYLSQKSDLPKFLRVEQVLSYANRRPTIEAQALYKLCRIDQLLLRRTDQLSGGEQQRVALARLLLGSPRLLLLDEPYSNLDREHKQVLQGIIDKLSEQLSITCLLVSHDAADTLSWADEILVLHGGRLVQQGTPERIYHQPVDTYTAALFGDYNLVLGADRRALAGDFWRDESLLVRPEQFQLGPAGSRGVAGRVRAVRFFGGFYEVEVQLPATIIRVRVSVTEVGVGEVVTVAVAAGSGWSVRA